MDLDEIRAKSAEISVNMCAHMTAAFINKHGAESLSVLEPLGLAKEIEEYIRTGKIPEPIEVKHK
jgi:putative heme iron utilization protein